MASSISVMCRSTHHGSSAHTIFYGPGFRIIAARILRHAQSIDKSVFNIGSHALSTCREGFRFFIPAMKRHQREGHNVRFGQPEDLRKVLT